LPLLELENKLIITHGDGQGVGLVTQVEVDANDPRFKNLTKTDGYYYNEKEAEDLTEKMGWTMKEDSGRGAHGSCLSETQTHLRYFSC